MFDDFSILDPETDTFGYFVFSHKLSVYSSKYRPKEIYTIHNVETTSKVIFMSIFVGGASRNKLIFNF